MGFIVAACGGAEVQEEPVAHKERTCLPPAGVSGQPRTIEDAVDLINAFDAPVTLPCVLESLDRPLHVVATSNNFSAQPAFGPNNPRIFIVIEELVLSVVTKGDGRPLLEFGQKRTDSRSLKAEIRFPIETELDHAAPYERVHRESGTSCAFCHLDEVRDDEVDVAAAYMSQIIPPNNKDVVELDYMLWSYEACDAESDPDRCAMFDSIFAHGDVIETSL